MDYLDLTGKKFVITGVANERSIAWGIARALHEAGAELAFLYMERVEKWVAKLVDPLENSFRIAYDAGSEEGTAAAFAEIKEKWGSIDGALHCIAYASKEALEKDFIDCSAEDFLHAQEISAYSLVSLARHARPLMSAGGSLVALSFIGSTRAMGTYHVMGAAKASLEACARYLSAELGRDNIRMNVISAGPVNTLSARGISGFRKMAEHLESSCALQDSGITPEDVGDLALFLFSNRSRHLTGDILFVDSGYHMMGR